MDGWGYVIAVVAGVIISEAIRWLRDWREGGKKYKVMLYAKRLEVHQKAYYYTIQLLRSLDEFYVDLGLANKEVKKLYLKSSDFFA